VSLGELIGGRAKMTDLMGPVGMASIVDSQVQASGTPVSEKAMNLLSFAALISINLGVINLLPIPGLDGSRLIFLGIEGIRRKKLKAKVEGAINAAGMVLLYGLMAFVFFNDIVRLFTEA
jgi:regulator of sigma E protease